MVSFKKYDFVIIKNDAETDVLKKNQVYCVDQIFGDNTISLEGIIGTYKNDLFIRIAMGRYDQ